MTKSQIDAAIAAELNQLAILVSGNDTSAIIYRLTRLRNLYNMVPREFPESRHFPALENERKQENQGEFLQASMNEA